MGNTHKFLIILFCFFKTYSTVINDSIDSTDQTEYGELLYERIEEISECLLDSIVSRFDVKIDSLSNKIDSLQDICDSIIVQNEIIKEENSVKNEESLREIGAIKEKLLSYNIDRIGIGYEEGLSLRIRLGKIEDPVKKQFISIIGFNYSYKNPTNGMQQKLHEGHLKLGFLREIAVFPKTRISAYLDFVEKFKQIETEPLITNPYTYNKYNMWISTGRAGLMLTVLSLDHFMFSFKFGLECSYFTPAYMNNESNTALLRINNGVFKWGINTGELSILETLINNIGIYVYF